MRNLLIAIAALLSLAVAFPVSTVSPAYAQTCAPTPAGMVSWWPLNETSGTAVADIIGPNSGTATGTIGPIGPPRSVTGEVGNALNFYVGSRVNVPAHASLNFGLAQSFTIDAWIKGHDAPIVGNLDMTLVRGFWLLHSGNKLRLQMGDGTSFLNWYGATNIDPNVWTFVAVSVDRSSSPNMVTFYTSNPTLQVTTPTSMTVGADAGIGLQTMIGGCPGNNKACDTALDEIEVFNRVVPLPELKAIFDAGGAGKCLASGQQKGMTWVHLISNPVTGTVTVGCNSAATSLADRCDAYHGDTVCTVARPLLCIYGGKPTPLLNLPNTPLFQLPTNVSGGDPYNRWSGGVVATTSPIVPPGTLTQANGICKAQFGPNWRVAEFHDGSGWNFQAYGGTVGAPAVGPANRFWVNINDQPANCWTQL